MTQMEIISSTRSPFAVKSGGHASNPGFSSTPGVHISLKRMDQIVLSEDNSTVEIGMGLVRNPFLLICFVKLIVVSLI